MALLRAEQLGLENFSLLCAHVRVPPAIRVGESLLELRTLEPRLFDVFHCRGAGGNRQMPLVDARQPGVDDLVVELLLRRISPRMQAPGAAIPEPLPALCCR